MKDHGPKSSTEYVREFRARLRDAGLVKKDVWIRPEYSTQLASVERRMREAPEGGIGHLGSMGEEQGDIAWSLAALHRAIAESRPVQSGRIQVHLLEGTDPVLQLVMREFGDLPIFSAVGGLQIIVQAVLWPVEHVADPAAFNLHLLQTHKMLPLSSVGVEPIAGVPCYVMFGSLDITASLGSVMFEVETLAENVIDCAEAYRPFLREDALAGEEGAP